MRNYNQISTMEKTFRTPHGTSITLIGTPKEVNYVLKESLRRNKIIMEIIKLQDTLNTHRVIPRNYYALGEKNE